MNSDWLNTYYRGRILNMFTILKKFDDTSKTKEFRAMLNHLCDLALFKEELISNFRDLGYPFYPEKGTPGHVEVMAQVDAYVKVYDSIMDKLRAQEMVFYKASGLTKMSRICPKSLTDAYTRYALNEISYEELIEEIKELVWTYYKKDVQECSEIVAENFDSIGLLPKKIINEFKKNLFEQTKEGVAERSTLIVEKNIRIIELVSKNI